MDGLLATVLLAHLLILAIPIWEMPFVKLCVAQTRPRIGPVEQNVDTHCRAIELAAANHADLIVFPELSLTGYEPMHAAQWSREVGDDCFGRFQELSEEHGISIGAGAPLRVSSGTEIAMILFESGLRRRTYSKRYLHADEEPYFTAGVRSDGFLGADPTVAISICYELSVPQHARDAANHGAKVYLSSVAKTSQGVEQARTRLSQIAREHSMLVMMSNCLGTMDGMTCAGQSAVWNQRGEQIAGLDDRQEGLIIADSESLECRTYLIS